jgi:hypothetical protein
LDKTTTQSKNKQILADLDKNGHFKQKWAKKWATRGKKTGKKPGEQIRTLAKQIVLPNFGSGSPNPAPEPQFHKGTLRKRI